MWLPLLLLLLLLLLVVVLLLLLLLLVVLLLLLLVVVVLIAGCVRPTNGSSGWSPHVGSRHPGFRHGRPSFTGALPTWKFQGAMGRTSVKEECETRRADVPSRELPTWQSPSRDHPTTVRR